MGDHRARIKIEMRMHGIEDSTDMWINWSPDHTDCDERIYGWCANLAARAMAKYHEEFYAADTERRENAEKEMELAEFKRLQAKYGNAA